MSTMVTLSSGQILTAMQGGGGAFYLGASQFTYSIPGAESVWSAYDPGEEPDNSYSILSAAQAANFVLALNMWDELIAPNFTQVADNAGGAGELRIAFTDMEDGAAGYAFYGTPTAPGGKVGDIWLNSDDTGLSYDPGTYDFATLLHEIGHTLGLKHPFDAPALDAEFENGRFTVMSYTAPEQGIITSFEFDGTFLYSSRGEVTQVTPMVIDISAVQSIYGADPTTRAGNTVYAFDDDDGAVLRAIYDAGGIDTIDLSATTRDSVIDLRPGAYSSIGIWTVAEQIAYWQGLYPWAAAFIAAQFDEDSYEWTDNLGIALTTTIENAVGGGGDDVITGNTVANTLTGGAGNDVLDGGAGADTMVGGIGNDTYYVGQAADVVTELAGQGIDTVITALANHTLAANVENLTGTSAGAQYLIGNVLDNVITAGAGNDKLDGKGGADTMTGGTGNDTYFVNDVGDVVIENAGEGTDIVRSSISYVLGSHVENLRLLGSADLAGTGNSLANYLAGNVGANTLSGLGGNDTIDARAGNDTISGGAGNDTVRAGDGADTVSGGTGDDTLRGQAGNDTLNGEAGNDTLRGEGGLDILNGGADNDTINGGGGADTINGGAGRDLLYGGLGNDTFVFGDGDTSAIRTEADRIFDWATGDRIDLSAMDANTNLGGNQAFTFIGNAAFSGTAGELSYVQAGAFTYLEGDTNGDGIADFSIRIDGTHTIAAGELVL